MLIVLRVGNWRKNLMHNSDSSSSKSRKMLGLRYLWIVVSETIMQLRNDAHWRFCNSNDLMKIVLLLFIRHAISTIFLEKRENLPSDEQSISRASIDDTETITCVASIPVGPGDCFRRRFYALLWSSSRDEMIYDGRDLAHGAIAKSLRIIQGGVFLHVC